MSVHDASTCPACSIPVSAEVRARVDEAIAVAVVNLTEQVARLVERGRPSDQADLNFCRHMLARYRERVGAST